jgi:deoxyribonuclease IV
LYGSHLSIAGGLHNALIEARSLRMDCVQVFTKNQRQWQAKPLTDGQIADWSDHRARTGIEVVVSHDSYLINLASPDAGNLDKSITLFREELLRCEALDIPWLVTHPGAHMGEGEAAGLKRVARSLDRIHKELPGLRTVTCLEVTAGQGTSLGWRFEHLRRIIDLARDPDRLAVCLDTAHMLAAGYDLGGPAACRAVLDEVDELIGLSRVKVLHINDSKVPRGKRVDRHAHIGHGHIARAAFGEILREPAFAAVPKILETPKEDAPDGRPWDAVNLALLRRLARPPRRRPVAGSSARRGA